MNAGRVRHHLANNVDNSNNTLLIVGYCSPDTPGGMLRNGIEKIKLYGEWKVVNIEIEIMDSFSAHADRSEMIDFFANQGTSLKKLFLVHGELDSQKIFKDTLHKNGYKQVEIPSLGKTYKLD